MNPELMLEVAGVRKSYGTVVALDGVDLEIAPGQIVGLVGPNGAGKTTLISIVAGLLSPDSGSVHVGGVDVHRDPLGARALMGLAPQELGVYLQLDALTNVRFFGRMAGLRGPELDSRIEEVVHALALEDLGDRPVDEMSGGEKRRVHTAIAMVHRPPLLLLDEPTAGVDVHTRTRLLEAIKKLANEGCAVCYTTHYLHEIEALEAYVAIIESGSIIGRGPVNELIAQSGGTVVEVELSGQAPPELASMAQPDGDGSILFIHGPDPGTALTKALEPMRHVPDQIRSVNVVQPSLESVYLKLTGRRFEARAAEAEGEEE